MSDMRGPEVWLHLPNDEILGEVLRQIEEFRAKGVAEGAEPDAFYWSCDEEGAMISYRRPLTEEEIAAAEAGHAKTRAEAAERQKVYDLETLERLLRKHGIPAHMLLELGAL